MVIQEALAELQILSNGFLTSLGRSPEAIEKIPFAGPDLVRDVPVFACCTVLCFVFNWGVRLLLVEPFVRNFVGMQKLQVKKCAQSIMEAIFYATFSLLGLVVVPAQPWVWPSERWWIGFTAGGHEVMRADLRFYYILYISRYAQMFVSVLLEPKRKDFFEMVLHHFVTVVVSYISYAFGWNRIGVVTMLLLDPADVPLHLAKVCKYAGETTKKPFWQFMANRLFESFACTFFITRLVMYSYVCWSATIEGPRNIPNYGGPAGCTCIGLLHTLLVLQFYWFYLIMKVAVRLLREGAPVEDVRSDDDLSPKNPPVKKKSLWSSRWMLACAVPALLVVARQCWISCSSFEVASDDLRTLLGGLWTVLRGDALGTKSLSHAAPNMPRDLSVFLMFCAYFFCLNWGVRLLLVGPVVRRVLNLRGPLLAKFEQSVMETMFYGGFMLIGLRVVPSQDWVWPSSKWWEGFAEGGHEIMRTDLRCYYIMYIARYAQAVISVLIETKRKDFLEMIVHHLVTVVVIYISYVYGWNRVGVVVMVLLDPADVPLHLAKLCKYVFEATDRHVWQFIADRLFEVFASVFFFTRLGLYGYVCWSAHIEATRYFPKGLPEWTCVALLYTLLMLQVYWFFLILRVAMRLMRGQGADDPRSDDEAETSPGQGKMLKKKDK